MSRILPAALIALLPATAQAACPGETFLSCTVGNGKHVEVCIQPGDSAGKGSFTYTFGPKGAPELSLSVPMSAGTVTPWSGVGRSIWASVSFPNDGYDYEVWHGFDRLDEDAGLEAGVNVLQAEKLVASLTCTGGEIAPVFTLEDTMESAGYCWNREASRWQRGDCG